MKKRDLYIVIIVIALGLLFNAIRKGDISIGFHGNGSDKSWELQDRNHPNEFPQEEIRLDLVDKIDIRNIAGKIEVEKAADNTPHILVQPIIYVYHKSQNQAEKIHKKIRIQTAQTSEIIESTELGDKTEQKLVQIETKSMEDFPLRRARVHLKLVIPEAVELHIKNRYGDIEINGCGKNIWLDAKDGDISVKHIDSNLKIDHKEGRVSLLGIKGKIDLSSRNSRVKINNVSQLKLNCYLSRVYINQVEQDTLVEYAGYSSITMDEGNGFSLEGRHTKIKLKSINNSVQIRNSHQSIYMKEIKGNININANNCRIDMEQIASEDVVIKNAYNYVAIDKISAKNLDVLMSNGDLDIAFNQIKEKINIKNKHSKVRLLYPASVQPLFNLQVLYGDVTNRTTEELTRLKERHRLQVTSNRTEGKPEINISTTYGDILLETSSENILVKKPAQKSVKVRA